MDALICKLRRHRNDRDANRAALARNAAVVAPPLGFLPLTPEAPPFWIPPLVTLKRGKKATFLLFYPKAWNTAFHTLIAWC